MPEIFVITLVDRFRRPILAAMSREEPDELALAQLAATAERFALGEAVDVAVTPTVACALCGCTDECACEGGCAWAEGDVCTRCIAAARRPLLAGAAP